MSSGLRINAEGPRTAYEPVIDSVWQDIDEIQGTFKELPWFGAHRFDDEVTELRRRLANAIENREADEDGESFRDFHSMRLLFECLDAIVYAPQLHAATVNKDYLRTQFALGLQLGATKALAGVLTDARGRQDFEHREYRTGIINELIPPALLNRIPVVTHYNSLVVPASKQEDTEEKIDIKAIDLDQADTFLRIQVKTRRGGLTTIPLNGVVIYGEDLPGGYFSVAEALRNDYQTSSRRQRRTLDEKGQWLANYIAEMDTPAGREQAAVETQRLKRDARRESGWTPKFTQNVGDNLVLQKLLASMTSSDGEAV